MSKPNLVKLDIIEHNCPDGEPSNSSYLFLTDKDADTIKDCITKEYNDWRKENEYKDEEKAHYDGFYFGNQFSDLIPRLEKNHGIKLVKPSIELEADFDNGFE